MTFSTSREKEDVVEFIDKIKEENKNINLNEIEIEVKFSNINKSTFDSLILQIGGDEKSSVISKEIIFSDDLRKTFSSNEGVSFVLKKRINSIDVDNYAFRIVASREEKVENPSLNKEIKLVRLKARRSYEIDEDKIARLDITKVHSFDKDSRIPLRSLDTPSLTLSDLEENKSTISYEIELELTDKKIEENNVDIFTTVHIENIIRILQQSNFSMSRDENERVIKEFERMFISSKEKENKTILDLIPKPKDLTFSDLRTNIIGSMPFAISDKTDGLYRLCFIRNNSIYLITPSAMSHNRFIQTSVSKMMIIDSEIFSEVKLIIAGEWIPNDYLFVAHDLIASNLLFVHNDNGDSKLVRDDFLSLSNLRLNERVDTLKEVKLLISLKNNDLFKFVVKHFFYVHGIESFNKGMIDALNFRNVLEDNEFVRTGGISYKTDGLIITPVNIGYKKFSTNPNFEGCHILRWKPTDRMTIDFMLNKDLLPVTYSIDSEKKIKFELFNPNRYPIDLKTQWDSSVFKEGDIVETRWLEEKKEFRIVGKRYDKSLPNATFVANSIWWLINDPISDSTIKGFDSVLMRKYHNRVKEELLSYLPRGSKLLDIGSGQGGDLSRWKHRSLKVYAVEPDKEKLKEFEKREKIHEYKATSKINLGGDNTKQLVDFIGKDNKMNAISMFFSLSFFFGDDNKLNSLIETIDSLLSIGGTLLITTIDGMRVKRLIEEEISVGKTPTRFSETLIEKNNYSIKYSSRQEGKKEYIIIDIKGSRVTNQVEWLVNIPLLRLKLAQIGIETSNPIQLSEEKFMSESERELSSLYIKMIGKRISRRVFNDLTKVNDQFINYSIDEKVSSGIIRILHPNLKGEVLVLKGNESSLSNEEGGIVSAIYNSLSRSIPKKFPSTRKLISDLCLSLLIIESPKIDSVTNILKFSVVKHEKISNFPYVVLMRLKDKNDFLFYSIGKVLTTFVDSFEVKYVFKDSEISKLFSLNIDPVYR